MTLISQLRALCVGKQFKSFKDLPVGDYVIKKFSVVETTQGARVRIEMKDWYMFLPERYQSLPDEIIAELNESTIVMTYLGKDSDNRSRIDFAISINDEDAELTIQTEV